MSMTRTGRALFFSFSRPTHGERASMNTVKPRRFRKVACERCRKVKAVCVFPLKSTACERCTRLFGSSSCSGPKRCEVCTEYQRTTVLKGLLRRDTLAAVVRAANISSTSTSSNLMSFELATALQYHLLHCKSVPFHSNTCSDLMDKGQWDLVLQNRAFGT